MDIKLWIKKGHIDVETKLKINCWQNIEYKQMIRDILDVMLKFV